MKIYVDIDGVLANFSKAAAAKLGIEYPKQYEFLLWDELFSRLPRGKFYNEIVGHDFWENIEPFPYADEIVKVVNHQSHGNWEFLTKPMQDAGCYSGKFSWVKKHFPKHLQKLNIVNGSKAKCCCSNTDILIDDSPNNITEWRNAGGIGLRWVEHTDDFDSIDYIEKLHELETAIRDGVNVDIFI